MRRFILDNIGGIGIEEAESLAHKALIKVWQKDPVLTTAQPMTYLRSAARLEALMKIRGEKRRERLNLKAIEKREGIRKKQQRANDPVKTVLRAEFWKNIRKQLLDAGTNPESIEIFLQHYQHGIGYPELARRFRIAEGTIASRINRIKEKIRL